MNIFKRIYYELYYLYSLFKNIKQFFRYAFTKGSIYSKIEEIVLKNKVEETEYLNYLLSLTDHNMGYEKIYFSSLSSKLIYLSINRERELPVDIIFKTNLYKYLKDSEIGTLISNCIFYQKIKYAKSMIVQTYKKNIDINYKFLYKCYNNSCYNSFELENLLRLIIFIKENNLENFRRNNNVIVLS
jgi:hypothetical protein